jgi:hypothetical protein
VKDMNFSEKNQMKYQNENENELKINFLFGLKGQII